MVQELALAFIIIHPLPTICPPSNISSYWFSIPFWNRASSSLLEAREKLTFSQSSLLDFARSLCYQRVLTPMKQLCFYLSTFIFEPNEGKPRPVRCPTQTMPPNWAERASNTTNGLSNSSSSDKIKGSDTVACHHLPYSLSSLSGLDLGRIRLLGWCLGFSEWPL